MKITKLSEQAFGKTFGIAMAPIDTVSAATEPGIAAAHGLIMPGQESALHRHDECELFVVVSGCGAVVADGAPSHSIGPGDVISIEPFDRHVVRNTGAEPLVFADLYWRDLPRAATRAVERVANELAGRPIFVFSTPPTPNGDLHLGHLSGPYLGADVYTRFQRMQGRQAYHITGSDDFQSYVIAKARQLDSEPQAVATRFAEEISATLAMMDVDIHQFTTTSRAQGYAAGLKAFFARLTASGGVVRSREPAAFDPASGAYLYECDVSGQCPTCGASCGGNICEECGEPNLAFDLCKPVSKLSGQPPVVSELERHVLPLDDYKKPVLDNLRATRAAPRLQALAERVFARESLRIPVTHPQAWGIAPDEPAGSGQVVWVWPEMAYGFLHGIEALGRRCGQEWNALRPQDNWKIVHFFGYDNSFYHTVLYPALYHIAYPGWSADIDYHVNEFYLLNGLKFSTSRQHAIWGKEVLNARSVDCVRYHLCFTRGEVERTNFDLAALARTKDHVLARWDDWLETLGDLIAQEHGGIAPDAGDWSADHRAFLVELERSRGDIEAALSPDGFSLNRAAARLDGLVSAARRFATSHRCLVGSAAAADRNRTTVALELAAALLLADAAAPLMPRFSRGLRAALGVADDRPWPTGVELLAPGRPVTLAGRRFFSDAVASMAPTLGRAAE